MLTVTLDITELTALGMPQSVMAFMRDSKTVGEGLQMLRLTQRVMQVIMLRTVQLLQLPKIQRLLQLENQLLMLVNIWMILNHLQHQHNWCNSNPVKLQELPKLDSTTFWMAILLSILGGFLKVQEDIICAPPIYG